MLAPEGWGLPRGVHIGLTLQQMHNSCWGKTWRCAEAAHSRLTPGRVRTTAPVATSTTCGQTEAVKGPSTMQLRCPCCC